MIHVRHSDISVIENLSVFFIFFITYMIQRPKKTRDIQTDVGIKARINAATARDTANCNSRSSSVTASAYTRMRVPCLIRR